MAILMGVGVGVGDCGKWLGVNGFGGFDGWFESDSGVGVRDRRRCRRRDVMVVGDGVGRHRSCR